MKIKYYYSKIAIIFLFIGCENSIKIENPDELIEQDLMEQILYEATLLEVMNTFSNKNPDFTSIIGAPYFYIKYGIDSLQLAQNEIYYTKNPRVYEKIHRKVLLKLERLRDSFNLLTKEKK